MILRALGQVQKAQATLMLLGALVIAAPVAAEVKHAAADSFWSSHTVEISASPDKVFRALTKEVSRWWNAAHSYSGEARNFRLQAVAGGCFCERLPKGGSVEHMRVVFVNGTSELRLEGGLGPLQTMGVAGSMVFRLVESGEGSATVLHYDYRVSGGQANQLDQLAEAVDAVQLDQLTRLKHWVEQRNPNWPALNQRESASP